MHYLFFFIIFIIVYCVYRIASFSREYGDNSKSSVCITGDLQLGRSKWWNIWTLSAMLQGKSHIFNNYLFPHTGIFSNMWAYSVVYTNTFMHLFIIVLFVVVYFFVIVCHYYLMKNEHFTTWLWFRGRFNSSTR